VRVSAWLNLNLKDVFQSRSASKAALGVVTKTPVWMQIASTMSGSSTRKKGLVAFSSAMVDGKVGMPRSRFACSLRYRSSSAFE